MAFRDDTGATLLLSFNGPKPPGHEVEVGRCLAKPAKCTVLYYVASGRYMIVQAQEWIHDDHGRVHEPGSELSALPWLPWLPGTPNGKPTGDALPAGASVKLALPPLPFGHYFDPTSTKQEGVGWCPIHGGKLTRTATEAVTPGLWSRDSETGWLNCPIEGCPCPRWRVPSARQLAARWIQTNKSMIREGHWRLDQWLLPYLNDDDKEWYQEMFQSKVPNHGR